MSSPGAAIASATALVTAAHYSDFKQGTMESNLSIVNKFFYFCVIFVFFALTKNTIIKQTILSFSFRVKTFVFGFVFHFEFAVW